MSDEDFHPRDMEMLDGDKNVRLPGSVPSFDMGSGAPRSLEQLLSGETTAFLQHPGEIPNDLMVNLQLIQRSMGAAAAAMDPAADGLDFDQADFIAKLQGKKRSSRTRSSEEEDALNQQMGDVSAYPSLVRPSSVGPLTSQGKGKNFSVGRNAATDTGRRCSSAGVGEGNRNRSPFSLSNSLMGESAASLLPGLKKDKKRKRSESVDSSMKSGAGPSVSLMPPPLISSTGDVTTSALMSPIAMSESGPPALRPLTLNSLKPMLPTSSSDPVRSPGPSAKKGNTVSSSGPVPSPRGVKIEKGKSPGKPLVDGTGVHMVAAVAGPGKGPKTGVKMSKNGVKIAAAGHSGPKFKQGMGMKIKTQQVTSSSSSTSAVKQNISSPPVSSSSMPASASSPSLGSGVSSTKSGSQLLKLQLQQQQIQQQQQISSAAAAAAAAVKKPKGSLSAVIDKLSKSVNPAVAAGESPSTSSPPSAEVKAEATAAGPSSRPDSSSGKSGSVLKPAGEKGKYSRNVENSIPQSQATFKATLSGSKLTISKKPTSSTEAKAGVKMKTTPAVPMKGSPASSSSSSSPSSGVKAKGTALVKKHNASPSGFKMGAKTSSSVSSSSSLLSTPPKQNSAGRAAGSGKVSSSGSTGSSSLGKEKITSSCGAGAILEEAIPRLRLDQLPKIPKTDKAAQAQAAAAQATAAAAAAAAATPPVPLPPPTTSSPPFASQPSSSVTTPPVMAPTSQPFFRRPGPGPRDQRDQQSVSSASTSGSGVQLSDRFQSNAITSSHAQAQNQNQEPLCSSSSGGSMAGDGLQVPPLPGAVSARSQSAAPSSGSSFEAVGSSGSCAVNPDKGVTSSSDADPDEPTSTPSSPVESVAVSEANPPPIIPTESFDENDSGGRAQASRIDSTGSRDSEVGHSAYSEETSGGKEGCCSSTSAAGSNADDEDAALPSKDEEDDEDGLVIDVDYSAPTPTSNTPSSRKETPTPGDPVSSSNAPTSQPASGPSSPSPEKSPASESPAVTPSASSSSFSWPTGSRPVGSEASGGDGPSPSQESAPSSVPGYGIDDELMDEALVGSESAGDEEVGPDVPVSQPPLPAPAPPVPSHHVHEPEPEL